MSTDATSTPATAPTTPAAATVPTEAIRSIAAQEFFKPTDLTVAGDESTPHGALFANTMLDDGRQTLVWGDKHEQIFVGFLTNAEFVRNPYAKNDPAAPKKAGVPTGQPQLVYLQAISAGAEPAVAIVLDDGRQRRGVAMIIDERLKWIAESFIPAILSEKPSQQPIKLRNALLEWAKENPSAPEARWLTKTTINAILGRGGDDGLGVGGWFTKDWKPIPCLLRVQVNGVDVDPNDPSLMVQSVARKEAQIDTPPSLRAHNIQRALDKKDPATGEPLLNPRAVAQLMGIGDDALNNSLLILKVVPAVAAAIDSGRLSQKVALIGQPGKRDAAFVVWPKGQPRSVISEPAQAFVLRGLLEAFPGDEQIRGAKAFKIGLRLRAEALKGNLTDEAARAATSAADADEGELTVAEVDALRRVAYMDSIRGQYRVPTDATATVDALVTRGLLEWQPWQGEGAPESGRKPVLTDAGRAALASVPDAAPAPSASGDGDTSDAAPTKKRPSKNGILDRALVTRLREHAGRAAAALPDPTENGLSTAAILDRQRDVASVGVLQALATYLAGDACALDTYPAAKACLVAAQAEAATPAAPTLSPEEVVQELCAAAIDGWEEASPDQFRDLQQLAVAAGAKVAGRDGSAAEIEAANARLAAIRDKYLASKESGTLDAVQASDPGVYLREHLYATT